jgi:UDP-2,3-diacylglucosamine pyrophosphatase LpxH
VRTAIVSDLHLGSAHGEDVARDAAIRRILLEEIAGADRLVLLGDALELRELPIARVLDVVGPFFEDLGEAMAGKPVVLVPGNHDHRLAEPLLEQVALTQEPLGLERVDEPRGEVAGRIASWLGAAELRIAYPGIWLREDVYAIHGHYMDCHWTLPRLECVAAAASMRAFGPLPERATVADYERVLRPVYGFSFGLAQGGARRNARPSERAWRAMSAQNGARRALLSAAVPAATWALNRVLRSEFDHDLSARRITGSGIEAATEMTRRLGLDGAYVLTGHTHRATQDDETWSLDGGGRLYNTGSWVFADAFHRPGTPPGPYWPGTVAWVEERGPPQLKNVLIEEDRDRLRRITKSLSAQSRRRAGSSQPI